MHTATQPTQRPTGTYGLLYAPTGNVICSYCGWISARMDESQAREVATCPDCSRQMPSCPDCQAGQGKPCAYNCSRNWI